LRVLAHPDDFVPVYQRLKSEPQKNKTLLDAIKTIKRQLESSDAPLGIHHKLKNVPEHYKKRYGVQALYHSEVPNSRRLMYTIRRTQEGKEALFLELLTHDEYDKRFDYFKKRSH